MPISSVLTREAVPEYFLSAVLFFGKRLTQLRYILNFVRWFNGLVSLSASFLQLFVVREAGNIDGVPGQLWARCGTLFPKGFRRVFLRMSL